MKKVVHLTSAHKRYDQRILWRECCSLGNHGYDVAWIVNENPPDDTLEKGIRILLTAFVPAGTKTVYDRGRQACEFFILIQII